MNRPTTVVVMRPRIRMLQLLMLIAGAMLLGFQLGCSYLSARQLESARDANEVAQLDRLAAADLLAKARAKLAVLQKERSL